MRFDSFGLYLNEKGIFSDSMFYVLTAFKNITNERFNLTDKDEEGPSWVFLSFFCVKRNVHLHKLRKQGKSS